MDFLATFTRKMVMKIQLSFATCFFVLSSFFAVAQNFEEKTFRELFPIISLESPNLIFGNHSGTWLHLPAGSAFKSNPMNFYYPDSLDYFELEGGQLTLKFTIKIKYSHVTGHIEEAAYYMPTGFMSKKILFGTNSNGMVTSIHELLPVFGGTFQDSRKISFRYDGFSFPLFVKVESYDFQGNFIDERMDSISIVRDANNQITSLRQFEKSGGDTLYTYVKDYDQINWQDGKITSMTVTHPGLNNLLQEQFTNIQWQGISDFETYLFHYRFSNILNAMPYLQPVPNLSLVTTGLPLMTNYEKSLNVGTHTQPQWLLLERKSLSGPVARPDSAITEIFQNGQWRVISKEIYDFWAPNQLKVNESWVLNSAGTWDPRRKEAFQYDQMNHLVQYDYHLYQTLQAGWDWVFSVAHDLDYHASGLVQQHTRLGFSPSTQTLIPWNRWIYHYPATIGLRDNAPKRLDLYPNPAADLVFLSAPDGIYRLTITNMQGQILKEVDIQITEKADFSVASLPVGNYIINLSSPSMSFQSKLVKW
jgi:hypothetical protein